MDAQGCFIITLSSTFTLSSPQSFTSIQLPGEMEPLAEETCHSFGMDITGLLAHVRPDFT